MAGMAYATYRVCKVGGRHRAAGPLVCAVEPVAGGGVGPRVVVLRLQKKT